MSVLSRQLLALSLAILLVAGASAQEIYTPKARPVIPQLALADGRVLDQAQILSDSAYTVTVKHGGRVEKIEKTLLPAALLAQWPVDEQRGAQERSEAEAAVVRRQAEITQGAKLAEKVRRENIREAKAQLRANKKHDDDYARRQKEQQDLALKKAEQLAASHDGLQLVGFGKYPSLRALTVNVRNVGENPRTLDWRQLRGVAADGTQHAAVDVRFTGKEIAGYDVRSAGVRTFTVVFGRSDLVAVAWADRPDLGWVDASGASVDPQQAVAPAKEKAIAGN